MDFTVHIAREGEIRVLQLTDMQVIDSAWQRTPDRLREDERLRWLPERKDAVLYDQIRALVKKTSPDLIFITGDITYGEFDDGGESQRDFIKLMDSFGIPWAPVYGNHDNETKMGADWQNAQYANARHCLFKKGCVFGNGNYTVGIAQNGKLIRRLFMLDSNGCGKLGIAQGLRADQLAWIERTAAQDTLPSFAAFHIPTRDFADAAIAAGYQKAHDSRESVAMYILGDDVPAKSGDFGRKLEIMPWGGDALHPLFKKCRIDGVFCGHYHKVNYSIAHDGVRYTLGLKTGYYDYHDPEAVGGTLICLDGEDFQVTHVPMAN